MPPSLLSSLQIDYLQPVILLLIFLTLKAFSRRGYVKLSPTDRTELIDAIEILKTPKAERDERQPRRYRRWLFKPHEQKNLDAQPDEGAIPMQATTQGPPQIPPPSASDSPLTNNQPGNNAQPYAQTNGMGTPHNSSQPNGTLVGGS